MFSTKSRYKDVPTYGVTLENGKSVLAVRIPRRGEPGLLGAHPVRFEERLDFLAYRYLADASAFWRLCDANRALSPDALRAHERVWIPVRER